jgi:hypothetical protein
MWTLKYKEMRHKNTTHIGHILDRSDRESKLIFRCFVSKNPKNKLQRKDVAYSDFPFFGR